jgi:ribose transport system substrate-binding protein
MDPSQRGGKKTNQPNLWPKGMNKPMDRRQFLVTGTSALTAAGLLAACGGGSDSSSTGGGGGGGGDVTFGFSHPFADVPVVVVVKNIVEADGKKEGWEVLLDETRAGEIQPQTSVLDTWITQGVTAINLFPPEPSAFEATAQRAVDAGIIWTTYAEEMPQGAGGVLFPAQKFGEIVGQATVDWINANDPEAEILFLEFEGPAQAERLRIPEKMIAEQTKAKIVAKQPAVEQTKGLQVTEDVLQAHPDISVVIGFSDDGALGAAEAFRKAGTKDPAKVFIAGQDGSEDALIALKEPNSYFKASAALDLADLGQQVVDFVRRAIQAEWKDGDGQEYVKLAPTFLEADDTKIIDKYLATYKQFGG